MRASTNQSGEAWIGVVPERWSVEPLGRWFRERKATVSDADFAPLSVTMQGIVPQLENVAKTDNNANRKLVRKGDFAINSRSDRKGSAGVSGLDGSVSVITTVLQPRGLNPRFTHHLLRSRPFQEEFYRWGHGIVDDLWSTKWSDMKSIKIPVPPEPEQRAIADYLDRETAQIDAFIAKNEELIALLTERRTAAIGQAVTVGLGPMSGATAIEKGWLANIPIGWRFAPIKTIGKVSLGKMLQEKPSSESDVALRYLRAASVQPNGRLDLATMKEMWFTPKEKQTLRLVRGDVVIVEGGVGGYGRAAFIPEDLIDVGFQNSIVRVRPNSSADGRFLTYVLLHLRTIGYIEMVASVASMPHFTAEKVAATRIPLPSLDQQVAIAGYLDGVTKSIDKAIEVAGTAMRLAGERRAALISAAVTGKIDVGVAA